MLALVEHRTVDQYLASLYSLSKEARQYIVSKLTDSLLSDEANAVAPSIRRKAKVKHRSTSIVSDEELNVRFSDNPMPPYPTEEPTWSEVIKSNSGRTIKPVEKWL